MKVEDRKTALVSLGEKLHSIDQQSLELLKLQAVNENNWFTASNIEKSINAWAASLSSENVEKWLSTYDLDPSEIKNVGLILAGNIPLVGLHDILSVFASGHRAMIKPSSQDTALIRFVLNLLNEINPETTNSFQFVDQLKTADAVIATGSDNTARYFKHYFGQKPNIIRQNRTSVAVVNGQETAQDFEKIGQDIFTYYGLGCRNISKLYIPTGFELPRMIDALMPFEPVMEHHKFRNNYDYNKSIYLVNKEPHLDSGFFLLREDEALVSPISVLYYEVYKSEAELEGKINQNEDKIQCIVSNNAWYKGSLNFGQAQQPELWDYADGVDTLAFLSSI